MRLPNMLAIGAHKAGSSSLYLYLNQHPEIYMSSVKELKFFSRERIDWHDLTTGNVNRWLSHCSEVKEYAGFFDPVTSEKVWGEATTEYLSKINPPERIHRLLPDVKLIAVLRNPVDRAYAHFCHRLRLGREPYFDIVKAIKNDRQDPQTSYLGRGQYHTQLQRHLEYCSSQQIKICLLDDLQHNPVAAMQDIFRFLGVNDTFSVMPLHENRGFYPLYPSLNRYLIDYNPALKVFRKVNSSYYHPNRYQLINSIEGFLLRKLGTQTIPPLSLEVREELMSYFRDDILQLQSLIQRDLSQWLDLSSHRQGVLS